VHRPIRPAPKHFNVIITGYAQHTIAHHVENTHPLGMTRNKAQAKIFMLLKKHLPYILLVLTFYLDM
jgi:hypothetical protein